MKVQRPLVFGAAAVLLCLVWFSLFVFPQARAFLSGRHKVSGLRQKVQETRQGLDRLREIEQQVTRLRAEYELPSVTPPPEQQLPELLEMIAQAGRTSQVDLISVKPKGNLRELSPGTTGYLELPLQVEAAGGYHRIGKFLDQLENSRSLVRVQQLRIQPDAEDMWRHGATLLLVAYLLPGGETKPKAEQREKP